MSSCCLAACGRLAENSQSGEAALTLCGRAPPAHLHPALRGWGGEGGSPLGNSVLCPSPQLCPVQGVQGKPPAHPLLSQCCSTRPPLSIPVFPLDQPLRTAPKALPVSPLLCCPFPLPWTCTVFPALPKPGAMPGWSCCCLQGVPAPGPGVSVSQPGVLSLLCLCFSWDGSRGAGRGEGGAQSSGSTGKRTPFPGICCGCPRTVGSHISSGSAPEWGLS